MCERKKYKIKCPYTEIVEYPRTHTVEVEADNEVDAIEAAWIKLYAEKGLDDDSCEEGDAEIIGEESLDRPPDMKTLKLFDDLPEGDADGDDGSIQRSDEETG